MHPEPVPGAYELPAWIRNGILLGATALGSAIFASPVPLPAPSVMFNGVIDNLPTFIGAATVLTWGGAFAAVWAVSRD